MRAKKSTIQPRRIFSAIAIIVCLGVSAIVAWQTSANSLSVVNASSAEVATSQDSPRFTNAAGVVPTSANGTDELRPVSLGDLVRPSSPDAAITFTQSTSQAITNLNSISCNNGLVHVENSYYRAFTLASHGITTETLNVTSVDIAIELADAGGPTQPVTIKLYTAAGFPAGFPGSLTLIGTATANVADQSLTILNIPVAGTVPPSTSQLVVEVLTPDGTAGGNYFFIGSNAAGQSGLGYIRAPGCGIASPTSLGAIGFPTMHMVMNVNGNTVQSCLPVASTFTNNTPVAIADVATVTSTLNVSGAGAYLTDVDLTTFITHTFAADLDITIQSPAGTIVTLTTDNGAGNDNVFNGTVWDDDANPAGQVPYVTNNGIVTDQAYVNLTTASPLVPEEAMGAFIGEDPNGTWTITISDDLTGDTGNLASWTLDLDTLASAPNVTNNPAVTQAVPTAIPTGPAVVTSTLNVSGLGTSIHDVDLTSFVLHTFGADLDITLTSPAGTVVTLTTDNGAGNDNIFNGTVWDDDANPGGQVPYTTNNGLATDHAYINNVIATPLVPEEAMSAFFGEDPNGTWTVTISDDLAGDGGTLSTWGLQIDTFNCGAAATTTTVASAPNPSVGGQAVTFTATVAPIPTGGSVTFIEGGTCAAPTVTLGGPVAVNGAGQAALNISTLVPGPHTVIACYSGNADFQASNGNTVHNVSAKGNTTTAINSDNPDPSVIGQNYTVTVTVTPVAPSTLAPTGNVQVSDGTNICSFAPVAGTGNCQLPSTSVGAKVLTATYSGNTLYNGSVSATAPHQVNPADTATSVQTLINAPNYGLTLTATATITAVAPGAGVPQGT
ncbi:MAG: Ig-like domain repeat protein, partial [Pyrinomonadaceae bacterium]